MIFYSNEQLFSFKLDGIDSKDLNCKISSTVDGNTTTTVYDYDGGLRITNIFKKYDDFGAYEWVNYFENTGDTNSQIISELWDCDYSTDIGFSEMRTKSPWWPDINRVTKIFTPLGSFASDYDFKLDADECTENNEKFTVNT